LILNGLGEGSVTAFKYVRTKGMVKRELNPKWLRIQVFSVLTMFVSTTILVTNGNNIESCNDISSHTDSGGGSVLGTAPH